MKKICKNIIKKLSFLKPKHFIASVIIIALAIGISRHLISDSTNSTSKSKSDALEAFNNKYIRYSVNSDEESFSEICYDTVDAIASNYTNNSTSVAIPNPSGNIKRSVIPESDFVKTSTDNLSTFSADVDTASYVTFRQMVNNNYPAAYMSEGTYRTEEFLNYFDYDYTNATNNNMFGITSEVQPCPWNKDNALVRIGVKAKEVKATEDKPLNLVFLIDSSGSMSSENKMPLLKKSLIGMLKSLSKKDTISIVTYSGESRVVLAGANGLETDKITKAINSLNTEGSTNGGAGMEMAYKLASKYYSKDANNRILLATDGDLNVGITSTNDIEKFVAQKRKSGIYLSVLGFGSYGYNDEIMETIADKGNGNYSIIDSLTQAKKILIDEFNETMATVATDVKFQVEFDKSVVNSYRLIGYDNRNLEDADFENDTKDAGEVGSGQTVTVLYEINIADSKFLL